MAAMAAMAPREDETGDGGNDQNDTRTARQKGAGRPVARKGRTLFWSERPQSKGSRSNRVCLIDELGSLLIGWMAQ
ncbi:hypothetical protein GX48_01929 [Paracoccidioides brasiliensis]|nr:hypothetical protein GX48_01929 [Paracoccidioides brasiliensis]